MEYLTIFRFYNDFNPKDKEDSFRLKHGRLQDAQASRCSGLLNAISSVRMISDRLKKQAGKPGRNSR